MNSQRSSNDSALLCCSCFLLFFRGQNKLADTPLKSAHNTTIRTKKLYSNRFGMDLNIIIDEISDNSVIFGPRGEYYARGIFTFCASSHPLKVNH